jgi:restriction system protein
LRRFGGTCCAVHEADVAVVVTTSSAAAPADEYAATCGMVCVDGGAWPPGPNRPHGRPGRRGGSEHASRMSTT